MKSAATDCRYGFVCVPAVSQTEWHPFTISSGPSDRSRTFHIKDMGEAQALLAAAASALAGNAAAVARALSFDQLLLR